jgi:chromosome segregation ATPase
VLEILEQEINQIEEEKTELKEYIDCLEVNLNYLEKINEAQKLRYQKLLKEKMKLQARIAAFEGKKPKSNLSQLP